MDRGVCGWDLTNPSFSRIWGFFLAWRDPSFHCISGIFSRLFFTRLLENSTMLSVGLSPFIALITDCDPVSGHYTLTEADTFICMDSPNFIVNGFYGYFQPGDECTWTVDVSNISTTWYAHSMLAQSWAILWEVGSVKGPCPAKIIKKIGDFIHRLELQQFFQFLCCTSTT